MDLVPRPLQGPAGAGFFMLTTQGKGGQDFSQVSWSIMIGHSASTKPCLFMDGCNIVAEGRVPVRDILFSSVADVTPLIFFIFIC